MKYYTLLLALLLAVATKSTSAVAATSSIMVDAKTGNVLYADNADALRYPASLTKLMTLYITFNSLENGSLKLDDQLKVSYTAAGRSPSRLGLKPGSTVDVKTAILGTIIKSANDCATVLGEAHAKDDRAFALLMTETAHKLGMKNTTFKNASGLQHSKQKTTARDMAILATALYHHFPQYYAWFSIPKFTYDGKTYTSHNAVLKDFDGADGLKTGYTAAAGYNIITSAKRGSHRVIAVTMGHQDVKHRDEKVSLMMDKALTLADSAIDIKNLKNQIDGNRKPKVQKQYALAGDYIVSKKTGNRKWALQTGVFASYSKAQHQAQKVKNKLAGHFSSRGVNVEKFQQNGKTMYRAQLIGFYKADAKRACNLLKNKGVGCIVKSFKSNSSYAQN